MKKLENINYALIAQFYKHKNIELYIKNQAIHHTTHKSGQLLACYAKINLNEFLFSKELILIHHL